MRNEWHNLVWPLCVFLCFFLFNWSGQFSIWLYQ